MNYFEAEEIIKEGDLYASPDFYRVQFTGKIALGLRDDPQYILTDVSLQGSEDARTLLAYAIECGYVSERKSGEYCFYDVIDVEESGAPYYFRSHIAMQIAYPGLYREFFGGEYVWTFSHPKMQQLVELCVSCLTNKKHPSDYYGEHEPFDNDKPKRGRPKTKIKPEKRIAPKQLDTSYHAWIDACQGYKQQLKLSWQAYLDACAERKLMEIKAKDWRDQELDKLRNQMKQVSLNYLEGMNVYTQKVENAKQAHGELKLLGKPRRSNFK